MSAERSGRVVASAHGRAPFAAGALLVVACLALAALSLLAPSAPSYDPFAWIVWGRELAHLGPPFSVEGGPSWKPLPVLFTSLFAFAGGAAPALWLVVARAGALLALAGAFRLGTRLAGRWAGAVAAVGVLLSVGFVAFAWRGASEPLLVACVLWALERHLAGRRGTACALALAAALIRPEAWPFLGLYVLVRWRVVCLRERVLIAGGLLLVALLWFGLPALVGDPFVASSHAQRYNGNTGSEPGWTALHRGLAQTVVPIWALALAAVLLRPRDRLLRALALGAAAWLALVVAMTIAGYPGLGRFMLPPAAVACVLAGVGTVALVARAGAARRWGAATAVVVLLAGGAALSARRAATLPDQVRLGTRTAELQDQLTRAIAAAGGRAAILRCAAGGAVAVNHTAQTALAWKLHVGLDSIALRLLRPGVLFRGPKLPPIGAPARIVLARPRRSVQLARVGVWRVLAVRRAGSPMPATCRPGA
jgi:hypothetical protein